MSLEERWLKKHGYWKDEYSNKTHEEIKDIANLIQRHIDNERYVINKTKYILTH